jgi:hypothetical protein
VLGEEHRIGANLLPIDRWMLDRMRPERKRGLFSRRRNTPPVAWHGRFATSARTPELEPAMASEAVAPEASVEPELPTYSVPTTPDYDDTPQQPATVGALALDMFVQPMRTADPGVEPPVVDAEPAADEPQPVDAADESAFYAAAPAEPAALARTVVLHEELEPEVRALVDDLHQQARAELLGRDTPALGGETVSAPQLEEPAAEPSTRGGWHPAAFFDDK